MPNWSYNTIALQGKKDAMHKFIKIGLENSGLVSTGNIDDDFALLVKEGKTKVVNGINTIGLETYLSARTFLPIPDTFLLYDTTNYPNKYPVDVVKEQKEKYGAIGWYDYNCKTLGVKWNFKIGEDVEPSLDYVNGTYRIIFRCDTAWSMPIAWLVSVKELVPDLFVGIMSHEESGQWYMVGYIENGVFCDYADYTEKMNKMFEDFNNARMLATQRIKSDDAKMAEIKATVLEENSDKELSDEELQNKIDWEIELLVDKEVGEWVDDNCIYDDLDESFANMIDEKLS